METEPTETETEYADLITKVRIKEKSVKKSLSLNFKEDDRELSPAFVIGDSPITQTPEKPKQRTPEKPAGVLPPPKSAEKQDKAAFFFNESVPSPLHFTPLSAKENESGELDEEEAGDDEAEDFNMDDYLKSLQQKAKADN